MPPSDQIKRGFRVVVNTERVTLPNGRRVELDIVPHPGAAAVVPFVDDGRVLMIRQYRHATGGVIWEVPAGRLEPGETPEGCAARELEEETGRRCGRLERLGTMWSSPGFCDERIHLFAAFELRAVPHRREPDECIETAVLPLGELLDLIWDGQLQDAKSALALVHAARHLGRLA